MEKNKKRVFTGTVAMLVIAQYMFLTITVTYFTTQNA